MNSNINKKYNSNDTSGASVHEIHNTGFNVDCNSSNFCFIENEDGYHLEFEIAGYVKEDFNFYINNNDLVLTTAKIENNNSTIKIESTTTKHTYCYPSALFKIVFHLPEDIVKNDISVDYNNHILSIDLTKLNTKPNI